MIQIKHRSFSTLTLLVGIIVLSLSLMTSCKGPQLNMMGSYLDTTKTIELAEYPFKYQEPTIRKYDIVRVKFAGKNPNVANQLNGGGGDDLETRVKGTDGPEQTGLQVDIEGNINFPVLGKVKAEGLTKEQLRIKLMELITPMMQNPFVLVDLPKRGVTILGEVKSPSTIAFAKERANLFETLAQVGFVTEYGDLSKVKVYRESPEGKRILANMNLRDTGFLASEFFYPQPDDVIYIPTLPTRTIRNFGQTYAPIATIILALSSLFITLFK